MSARFAGTDPPRRDDRGGSGLSAGQAGTHLQQVASWGEGAKPPNPSWHNKKPYARGFRSAGCDSLGVQPLLIHHVIITEPRLSTRCDTPWLCQEGHIEWMESSKTCRSLLKAKWFCQVPPPRRWVPGSQGRVHPSMIHHGMRIHRAWDGSMDPPRWIITNIFYLSQTTTHEKP